MISIREFAPDASEFDVGACDRLVNLLPFVGGFRPAPGLETFGPAVNDTPRGSFCAYKSIGVHAQYVGTDAGLFILNSVSFPTITWDDISGTTYSVPSGGRWRFTQYGDLVVATNGADNPQSVSVSLGGSFADLANAPVAKFCGVIGDFLMLLSLGTSTKKIQWSGLNQPTFWTPRQRSSDFQDFPDGGDIMGFSGFEKGCVIFQENAIREGSLSLDTPLIIQFRKTVENHGVVAPDSIVTTGEGIFYLSHDGFCKYGNPPIRIGEGRVDKFFLENAHRGNLATVQGCADPDRRIVYWAYQSVDNETSGTFDKILCYNYGLDRWSQITVPSTLLTWIGPAIFPFLVLPGQTSANANTPPQFGAFDDTPKLGTFTDVALAGGVTTKGAELSPGSRTFVSGFRPACDAATITGSVDVKDNAGASWTTKTTYTKSTKTGLIPARSSGRFHRFKIDIAAAQTWNTLSGFDIEARQEGRA